MALHDMGLSFGDLIKGVVKLLSSEGIFWVILPERQMQDLESIAEFFDFFPGSAYHLRDRPGKKILRIVQEFSFQKKERSIQNLLIKDENGVFSISYRKLLSEFLLIF
jgi:tRNA1Val (adenine37-N6)-methyltransferase